MIYVLYGENEIELDKFIKELEIKENIDTKVVYNYNECKIEDLVEEAGYFDLFGNKKIVILNDSNFLTSKSTLENKTFNSYIENPNNYTILILKIITDKLDERKKIVKTLKENATFKEFKLPDDKNINEYIKKYFIDKNYTIKSDAIKEISDRLISNPKVINSELEKLIIYKYKDKIITIDDVKRIITKYTNNSIFALVDAVVKKDIKEIFNLYKILIDDKEEPSVILVLLANQFRLMYQVKVLSKEGLDKYKIASFLNEHHYRVSLALEKSRTIEENELLNILKKLALIDVKIKTGTLDKTKALETFFLEI